MTPRENLLSLLRREGYEQAPFEFSLTPAMDEKYRAYSHSDLPCGEYFGFPWRHVEGLRLPPRDLQIYLKYFDPPLKADGEIDAWGVGHEPSPTSMHMTYMRNPMRHMESVDEMAAYEWPDYKHADDSHMREQAAAVKARGLAAVGNMQCTVWESAWYLRGMEALMMDMVTEDEKAAYLLDRVTEIAIWRAEAFARAGVDILYLGDDIGMQRTPMMGDALYTAWLKPRLKRVIDAARAIHPGVIVFYHSCGFVTPFIDHLIEAGVDVLNPIQSESMDFREIHARYGDRISFHGTIGTQTTMPFGTPEEVRAAVTENLSIAGPRGGLFVAPTHVLEPEVPFENVLAYVQACREYRPSR